MSCSSELKFYVISVFIYLFITTEQKDQRPLTLSVKAQEVKSTCNMQCKRSAYMCIVDIGVYEDDGSE